VSRGATASAVSTRYVRSDAPFPLYTIRLQGASDAELGQISAEMSIGLSVDEMKRARDYFAQKKRDPTDVELEALGQAWSEHCCYKSSKPVLKKNIYGIAEEKIFARGDAGVVEFDQDHFFVAKIESHNHPSAIEPYGGAATGVGGIIRDVLCCGAQPIALVDPLFFGPLDFDREKLPKGVKHPRYLFQGVVEGIRDYGNRVGLPTIAGSFYFHEGFTWNCLVNVGCIGVMPKKDWVPNRAKAAGNVYIYAGGLTGRDGIHGVTFASAELTEGSEETSRSAVQVGDPITKEPLIHAVREIVEKRLLVGMKDFGGGGLSCVAGELAWDAKLGAEIHLEKIPLKEEGLTPWEIWVSESQERMMLVVEPEKAKEVLHIFRKWDVVAVEVGRVIPEPVVRAFMDGRRVLELDLAFSTAGPVYDRPIALGEGRNGHAGAITEPEDYATAFLELLGRWNICSKEWVVRQYDHTVRANTVLQPLQGKIGVQAHGDASVLKPIETSWRGLAVTCDVNPSLCEADPYWGAASAMDESIRNLAAVGARASVVCDNLNFGNPEDPKVMGQLSEATRGLAYVARELQIPFSSGNVSLYNDNPNGPVPPTPTLMALGIVQDIRQCVTTDLKAAGDKLFLVGQETKAELGGSEYARMRGAAHAGAVPRVDAMFTGRAAEALVTAIEAGLVRACHDLSEGGLAVALAEMALGGDVGATVNLEKVAPGLRNDEKLFSETNTRWILEVAPDREEPFRAHFTKARVPVAELGTVGGTDLHVVERRNATVLKVPLTNAREAWTAPLHRVVAG
jgi:phosphoribosylformylglycinamidine synthase subunit PurL